MTDADRQSQQAKIIQLEYPYPVPVKSKNAGKTNEVGKEGASSQNRNKSAMGNLNKMKLSRVTLTSIAIAAIIILAVAIILECVAKRHDATWQSLLEGKESFSSRGYFKGKKLILHKYGSTSETEKPKYTVYNALRRDKGFQEGGYIIGLTVFVISVGLSILPIWTPWLEKRQSFYIMAGMYFVFGSIGLISVIGLVKNAKEVQEGYQVCYKKMHDLALIHANHSISDMQNARSALDYPGHSSQQVNELFEHLTDEIEESDIVEHAMDPGQDEIKRNIIDILAKRQGSRSRSLGNSQSVHDSYHSGFQDSTRTNRIIFNKSPDKDFKETEFLSYICYICGQQGVFGMSTELVQGDADGTNDVNELVINRTDVTPPINDMYDYNTLKSMAFCQEDAIKLSAMIFTLIAVGICYCATIVAVILPQWALESNTSGTPQSGGGTGGGEPAGTKASVSGLSSVTTIEESVIIEEGKE